MPETSVCFWLGGLARHAGARVRNFPKSGQPRSLWMSSLAQLKDENWIDVCLINKASFKPKTRRVFGGRAELRTTDAKAQHAPPFRDHTLAQTPSEMDKPDGDIPQESQLQSNELVQHRRRTVNGNPFGHVSPTLPTTLLGITFFLFLIFFVVWGASLYWSADVPYPMSALLPAAKAAGRGSTLTLSILYFTTFRTTQTGMRRLLSDNRAINDWLVGAIPFHDLMPRIHAFLGVISFLLATTHSICHALDYAFMWGTTYWPVTWGFPVNFNGYRSTGGLLVTGILLYLCFVFFFMVPGIPFYYFRGLQRPAKDATRNLYTWFLETAPKLIPSHLAFINLHWIGFFIFTLLISIHAFNQTTSNVAVAFWVLGLWGAIDLILRYLPASEGTDLTPTDPTKAYFENGKATGVLLSLPKPEKYEYQAGQYSLLRTKYFAENQSGLKRIWLGRESHPFSIANAPTDRDRIAFIIGRAEGWTAKLFDAVQAQSGNEGSKDKPTNVATSEPTADDSLAAPPPAITLSAEERGISLPQLTFTITRPQGAPAQDHFTYDSVLLVGTGVGCTAMMSVFASLVTSKPDPRRAKSNSKKNAPGYQTGISSSSFSSARSSVVVERHCGIPSWTISVAATVISFTFQLMAALIVTLVYMAVEIRTETSAYAVLSVDIFLCSVVVIITFLRVLWFITVLLDPSAWRHSRKEIAVLLGVDTIIFLLASLQIAFDALGIADIIYSPEVDIYPWIFEAVTILGFLSTVFGVVRIWVYLHLHSPHGHGDGYPRTVRCVLSSSAHMDALDALLGDILSVDPVRARTPDPDGMPKPEIDWGAVLKVAGSGAAAKQPYDVSTFLEPGVQRHPGARFVDGDWENMIRKLMDKMHKDHEREDRAVFLGIFYCGNQKVVRDALGRGLEKVQKEHFDGIDGRLPCEKCFGRVMVETF